MIKDDLGSRMKEFYENRAKTKLLRRTPVIIRIDGKAFHTFTRGFEKPFDLFLVEAMQNTMMYLCESIQGCVIGYTQSDEISLALVDYKNIHSDAWFDNSVEKLCSISASMATLVFNRSFANAISRETSKANKTALEINRNMNHIISSERGAIFDSRCFNLPKEEVTNYFLWRQQDASRNSINSLAQTVFPHKELQGLSTEEVKRKLVDEKGIDWDNYPTLLKKGSCCIKVARQSGSLLREIWEIDNNIPDFVGDGRYYIENLINF